MNLFWLTIPELQAECRKRGLPDSGTKGELVQHLQAKPQEFKTTFEPGRVPMPVGTCFEDAFKFILREKEGELVHGWVVTENRRIRHAWVDCLTGYTWEPSSSEFLKKQDFDTYFKPQEENRYSVEQASILAVRTRNYGPWTEREKTQAKSPDQRGDEARKFIKRIRNQRKRVYASAYLGYLLGKRGEPDSKEYAISYMAAQGVRMELTKILGK